MRWKKKTGEKLFRLIFSTDRSSRKSRKTQSKKFESKKTFFDCIRKLGLGFSRKRPFSTDKSDKWPKAILTQQSDSASRVGFCQSTTALFDWIFLVLLIISRVDVMVFVLLETVGVRECCCMAVKNRLAALCFARSSRAKRASRATNLRPSGLVALGSAESRQSYVRGVALSREPPKVLQA